MIHKSLLLHVCVVRMRLNRMLDFGFVSLKNCLIPELRLESH